MLDRWVIGVVENSTAVERLIEELAESDVDVKMLSVVGSVTPPQEGAAGFYTVGGHIRTWGGVGAFWSRLWGILLGAAVFWLPDLSLIAAAGPFVESLADDVGDGRDDPEESDRVLTSLFRGLEVGRERIAGLAAALRSGRYLVITRGPPQEVEATGSILEQSVATEVHVVDVVG